MSDQEASNPQWRSGELPSERVIEAVAAYSNTPPEELPPLYNTLDPDALDVLFPSDGMNGRVDFSYANYKVTLRSDKEIELSPVDE